MSAPTLPKTYVNSDLPLSPFSPETSPTYRTPAMAAFEESLGAFKSNPKFVFKGVAPIAYTPFGPFGKANAGFAFMGADVEYAHVKNPVTGNPMKVPGLALVRGGAVTAFVLINCEGEDHVLLTQQARLPIGDTAYIEVPAGMLDEKVKGQAKFAGVAADELCQEAGVTLDAAKDLTYLGEFVPSAGGCDERIKEYFARIRASKEVLTYLEGRLQGAFDENEQITVLLRPLSVVREQIAKKELTDAKLGMCLLHYLLTPELHTKFCERHLVMRDGVPHMEE